MIEPRLLARLERKKAELDALRPLPSAAVRRLDEQMAVEWTYHSNAIEGSTLTLRETQFILETGLTVGGKSLREHFEVINHREAVAYVQDLAGGEEPITPFHVRQIHKLVMSGIDDENAGQYRSLPVRITGSAHQPPGSWEVPSLMEAWVSWLQDTAPALHPIERAAVAHHRLAAIHPFMDGNGRTARLVMNLLLLREGYPPTIIQRTNRRQYYRALARADAGLQTGSELPQPEDKPLIDLIARAVERSLTLYLEACTPRNAPPPLEEAWIPLREAAQGTPYSQEYLGLLARKGRLEAIKQGRIWFTTRRAVKTYQQSVLTPTVRRRDEQTQA
jgi:Fic family protein